MVKLVCCKLKHMIILLIYLLLPSLINVLKSLVWLDLNITFVIRNVLFKIFFEKYKSIQHYKQNIEYITCLKK
jgi:hypothetical protein